MNVVLEAAKKLEERDGIDAALDLLYDGLEAGCMRDPRKVDEGFSTLATEPYSDTLLLGVLTITLPYAPVLPSRLSYAARVRAELLRRHGPTHVRNLLEGLV